LSYTAKRQNALISVKKRYNNPTKLSGFAIPLPANCAMWKKHPLTRFIFGFSLALILGLGLGVAYIIGEDYWSDGSNPPVVVEGKIANKSPRSYPRNNNGSFDLIESNTGSLISHFELRAEMIRQIQNGQNVLISMSPHIHHIYSLNVENLGELVQDEWVEGALFQEYQAPAFWTMACIIILMVFILIYALVKLADWLLPPYRKRGIVVARIEQADFNAAGYGLLLRSLPVPKARKNLRFELNEMDFLSTDGVDFVEVCYTPLFQFVREVKILRRDDFELEQLLMLEREQRKAIHLRYLPGWQQKLALLSDGIIATALFSGGTLCLFNSIPGWLDSNFSNYGATAERFLLPGTAIFLFCMGLLFSVNFLRKLKDLKAPKKITTGPVLSKWRVNGGTNDTRRQIVVADGGLESGSDGVRKFEISNFLFDELQVGDVVEIEHTPRLRFIVRLEVKGHQELLREV
jgi:hypothetical protein